MNELKTLEQIREKIACGFGFAQMLEKLGLTIESLKEQAEKEHRIKTAIFNRYGINLDEQTENKTGTEGEQKPAEQIQEQENTEQKAETVQESEQKAETEKTAEIHKITLADIKKKPRKNKKK